MQPTSSSSPPPPPPPSTAFHTASATQPLRSPPLAFEKTPNDALIPPSQTSYIGSNSLASPSSIMGHRSPLASENSHRLDLIIDQQKNALQMLHNAFAAERQAWCLERESLYSRIARLEQLLKMGDHYSPAKSPVLSPSVNGDIVSPSSRALAASQVLPTIEEDDNSKPLSARRDGAPQSIEMPGSEGRRQSSVTFTNADGFQVEEIPVPSRTATFSPPPPNNRILAGHTPVRVPIRPPTPPPQNMSLDGIEDTPTRNNTHINAFLTKSNEEEDPELKGPLNMPELPNNPDATNFTLDALSKRLEQIEKDPAQSKPLVFAQPSPGLASPVSERGSHDLSPFGMTRSRRSPDVEAPFAPIATRNGEVPQSEASPNALSPSISNSTVLSPQEVAEAKIQSDFEQGGIKLKKKASVNFGAPFGSLAGFPPRRSSQDKS